jgi:hypothetical protein
MKKVAIIAGGNSYIQTPFDDNLLDKWSLNDFYTFLPIEKINRWFEIHDDNYLKTSINRFNGKPHLQQLQAINVPIINQEYYLKNNYGYKYYHNTIAYMIATAIFENYKEIYLYGVDMVHADYKDIEVITCIKWWLGFAEGKGIKIIIPEESILFNKQKFYGVDLCE